MNDAAHFHKLAMQSLLPGLTYAVERHLEVLNEARLALGQPPITLDYGWSSDSPVVGRSRLANPASFVRNPSGHHLDLAPNPEVQSAKPRRGRPPLKNAFELSPASSQTSVPPTETQEPKQQRRVQWSMADRKRIGQMSRERWALVRAAGIKWGGKGSPSSEDVERARKAIAKKERAALTKASAGA